MPNRPVVSDAEFKDPYYYMIWGLTIVMAFGVVWALTPWFPWK